MTNGGEGLAPGTRLEEFEIQRELGAGGFGVTYLAQDVSLATWRAVKEYLPREWGQRRGNGTVGPRTEADAEDYRWGLERFLEEARILAQFDHRNVVRVYRVFEARGTAYMVTEYVEGRTLKAEAAGGSLPEGRVREVLRALSEGLGQVHAAGLLHRDIKPENVMVRADGTPVLIDFGAARQAMGQHSRSMTAVLTPGYAPIEQYSARGRQGPWTDIYALGAVAYWALSGEVPEDAIERLEEDRVRPVAEVAQGRVSESLATAVDTALALERAERPQSVQQWRALLEGATTRDGSGLPGSGGEERTVFAGYAGAGSASRERRWGILAAGLAVAATMLVLMLMGPEERIANDNEMGELAEGPGEAGSEGSAAVLGGSALLVVETTPAGAEVLVDGTQMGETPLERADIRAGVREVTLRHRHYETVRLAGQQFEDGVALRVERVLERGVGGLTVSATPRQAWVEVGGQRLAERTPVTLNDLPAGPLRVRLGAAEHRPMVVELEIPKGGLARLERTLSRVRYGSLTVELDPPDATVTLPDVRSRYRPGVRLPEGAHRLIVRGDGYREAERTVNISGHTRVRIALEQESLTARTARKFEEQESITQPTPADATLPPPPPVVKKKAPPKRIRVGGTVAKARLTRQVRPQYPPLARQARIQGTVKLSAVISKDGSIQKLEVMSGHPLLVEAALAAVKQWRYKPTLLNGEAVEVLTNIDANFNLIE